MRTRVIRATGFARAGVGVLAALCAGPVLATLVAAGAYSGDVGPQRFEKERAVTGPDAPTSPGDTSQPAMQRAFYAFMPGRWGADCARLMSAVRLDGNRLLGDTFFNGVLGSQLTLRAGSVKYLGLQNGLHQFEYHVDTQVMANNETSASRIIMETDLRSMRRTVYSEGLTNGTVYIRNGILQSNSAQMPMQKRCN